MFICPVSQQYLLFRHLSHIKFCELGKVFEYSVVNLAFSVLQNQSLDGHVFFLFNVANRNIDMQNGKLGYYQNNDFSWFCAFRNASIKLNWKSIVFYIFLEIFLLNEEGKDSSDHLFEN